MTWPTNWIEQAQYFARLQTDLTSLQAQSQTVTVHSFGMPTQQQWEDAYAQQVGQVPPIQPGTKLFWYDLKNGVPKRYATVTSSDGLTIDPLVRPFVSRTQSRGCFRFLGSRQLFHDSQINPVNSPIRHKEFSLMFSLGALVQKNLVALVIQYRMFSPVWISVAGDARGVATPDALWAIDQMIWWTTERAAGVTTSANSSGSTDGYVRQTGSAMTIVATEQQSGYTLVFAPAAAFHSGEYQPFNAGMMYMGLTAAQTALATPMHFWQSAGLKSDASGLKELYFGTADNFGLVTDRAYVYGIFATDPGPFEVFDDSI